MLLAGCGGGSHRADPACRAQAVSVAEHASSMVLHYRGGTIYPADMSYLGLQGSLRGYRRRGCPEEVLGATLRRRLRLADRRTLLAMLPRPTARALNRALAPVR